LGKESFRECKSLESVTFESGSRMERIEEYVFYESGLKSILIPSSVFVLGNWSFRECNSLESVIFESGSRLERIGECAFYKSGLQSIEIPGRVTFIGGFAFARISLTSISVSPDNTRFRLREFFLEDFDGSTIHRYFGSCRSIVIPSSVFVLGKESFRECKSLESVIFESGSRLDRIQEFAFSGSGLKSILIPSSVFVLGKGSFLGCSSLESVIFESGSRLDRIKECAFPKSMFYSVSQEFTRSKKNRNT
jgi:hypothetical protein